MVIKEFRQVRRNRGLLRVIFVAPVMQLILFGYAVSTDVRGTATFVVDHDRSRDSRDLIEAFTASGYFRLAGGSERSRDLVRALDHGRATVGLEIPAGYSRALRGGDEARVQVLLDGTNSNTATIVRSYAERIVQQQSARATGAEESPAVDLRARAWFNPDLASRNYNVPAVIGAIMFLVCLLLTSLAVVREREIGTLEQLMVSPLTGRELIAGKAIPFAIIGLVDLAIVTAAALLWFGVPFRGSPPLLLAAGVLYLISGLGIGLLVSTVSNTQQEAFMAALLVFMPTILLSGFMFPVSSMPAVFQWITLLNPMRHFLVIVRGIFLKGIGLDVLWPQFLALFAMGVGLLGLASARFRMTAR
jgi:ABC-2 type transport system permease protein